MIGSWRLRDPSIWPYCPHIVTVMWQLKSDKLLCCFRWVNFFPDSLCFAVIYWPSCDMVGYLLARCQHPQTMNWAVFRVCLRVDPESTPRWFLAQFAFRVCFRGTSEAPPTYKMRQNAPLNWPLVQPIRIVLLIAIGSPLRRPPFWKTLSANQSCSFNWNGGPPPLWKLPFSRQNWIQSR